MSCISGPYNLKVLESCFSCPMHETALFCHLPRTTLTELNAIRQTSIYPAGAVLFLEGEDARGLYIICNGQARLTATSPDSQVLILRTAETGEVLGLSSIVENTPFLATAETTLPSQVSFIPRLRFLQFLRAHTDVALHVSKHLAQELHKSWEQARLLAHSRNTDAKVAHFILDWAIQHGKEMQNGLKIPFHITHEEIAKHIGASRESVTRSLSDLKHREWIRLSRGMMVMLRSDELKELAIGSHQ